MRLKVKDDCTGVPNAFQIKAILQCDGPPSTSCITAGTLLESGSLYPLGDRLFRELVKCVGVAQGSAIVEVAVFCDGADGKMRVWEMASFLVSVPADLVNMPVAEPALRWVLWDLLTSCLCCGWASL
jgi:hypothetical protein